MLKLADDVNGNLLYKIDVIMIIIQKITTRT